MRQEHPLWLNPASGSFTVSRYENVALGLKRSAFSNTRVDELFKHLPDNTDLTDSSFRSLLAARLLFTEGEQHARMKSLIGQSFSHRHLQNSETLNQQRLDYLLDGLNLEQPVDIIQAVIKHFPGMVILSILGLPVEEQDDMKSWTDSVWPG